MKKIKFDDSIVKQNLTKSSKLRILKPRILTLIIVKKPNKDSLYMSNDDSHNFPKLVSNMHVSLPFSIPQFICR